MIADCDMAGGRMTAATYFQNTGGISCQITELFSAKIPQRPDRYTHIEMLLLMFDMPVCSQTELELTFLLCCFDLNMIK